MAQGLQWNLGTGIANTAEIQFSWFIGVIIGAFVAGLVITHVPKKYFYVSQRIYANRIELLMSARFSSFWAGS